MRRRFNGELQKLRRIAGPVNNRQLQVNDVTRHLDGKFVTGEIDERAVQLRADSAESAFPPSE